MQHFQRQDGTLHRVDWMRPLYSQFFTTLHPEFTRPGYIQPVTGPTGHSPPTHTPSLSPRIQQKHLLLQPHLSSGPMQDLVVPCPTAFEHCCTMSMLHSFPQSTHMTVGCAINFQLWRPSTFASVSFSWFFSQPNHHPRWFLGHSTTSAQSWTALFDLRYRQPSVTDQTLLHNTQPPLPALALGGSPSSWMGPLLSSTGPLCFLPFFRTYCSFRILAQNIDYPSPWTSMMNARADFVVTALAAILGPT